MSTRDSLHLTDEQLDDYADGVMSAGALASAEAHLAACEQCRRAVSDTRELLAWATHERATGTAPAELWPLVASSTIHLAEVRRAVLRSMRGLLVAGALAIAAATAVVAWKLARWTSAERDAPARVTPASSERAGGGGPGRHAGHPVVPTPPTAPRAPEAPRP
jgi:predicted anti-sigma-YlaC factor YlaD